MDDEQTTSLLKSRDEKLKAIEKHVHKQLKNLEDQMEIEIADVNCTLEAKLKRFTLELEVGRHQHLENIVEKHAEERRRLIREAREMEAHVLNNSLETVRKAQRSRFSAAIQESEAQALEALEEIQSSIGL